MFLDESGFMLQPVVRRTWAPRGHTPVEKSWDRHDRLSPVAALSVSPRRRRLRVFFRVHPHNVCWKEVVSFLRALHRHLGRCILVLDRWSVHRKAVRVLRQKHPRWFDAEWLPPYAPELNPVEQVWNHSKYSDLANFLPKDVAHLRGELRRSIRKQRGRQPLLRSFFEFAGLGL